MNDALDPDYMAACREVDELAPAAPPITPLPPRVTPHRQQLIVACAVCRRPVEHVRLTEQPFSGEIAVRSLCHGRAEAVLVARETMRAAVGTYVHEAFASARSLALPPADPTVAGSLLCK